MAGFRTVVAGDGVALHVELDGPDDAPVTVVLVHGWTLDRGTWGPVARALGSGPTPFRVLRPDHRGHGRSAAADPTTMTIEQLADDLAVVIGTLAPDGPLVLAGHSMGGMTLMALAERHPRLLARVGGVVLVATASGGLAGRRSAGSGWLLPKLAGSPWWARRARVGFRWLVTPGVRRMLLGRRPGVEARRISAESVVACRPSTYTGFLATLRAHERGPALAAFADIPTEVLVGTRDRLTPVAASRRIAAQLPSAGLTVFAGAGHMLPLERWSAVAARIAALATPTPHPPTPHPPTRVMEP